MKIRIKGNSVRIRLSRPEVDAFGKGGYLEERTEFGNKAFVYALESRDDIDALAAAFTGEQMTLMVPAAITKEWTTTDSVGYDHNMAIGDGKQLYLLIEKDFKCIDAPPGEDQSDNYEHPTKAC